MDFAPADGTADETPADADEADAELPDNVDDVDDDHDSGYTNADETADEDVQTVDLAWVPEEDDPEKALPFAVEANGDMIDGMADQYRVEEVERTVEHIRDDLDELREENRELRERIDSLEGWKGDVVRRLNEVGENMRLLLTESGLDATGSCPECDGGSLEKVTGFGETNRIECSGEDCDHVAAELE
jgi:hypothetical protein